jgi:hypothetical protein
LTAIPYEYPGTGITASGEVREKVHTFTIPVGKVSKATDRAWLSFKCAVGAAASVRLMAIASGTPASYLIDQTWTNVAPDATRVWIEAPSGSDQLTAIIQSEHPYSLGLETKPKH